MTLRDKLKIGATSLAILIVLIFLVQGFRHREKKLPYKPAQEKREIPRRVSRTRRTRNAAPAAAIQNGTNAVVAGTEISMKELRHMRAVMCLPEGDPIPGFDTKGLVDNTLSALRSGATLEEKLNLMNQIAVIGDKMVMPAVLAALEDPDIEVRSLAVESMKAIDDPSVTEGVIKALDDSSPDIREEAVECVATLTPEQGLNEVVIKALRDQDEAVRENALDMLTMLVDDAMMPSLDYALDSSDVDAQETALSLLEQLYDEGSSNALDPVIDKGLLSPEKEVRDMALDILKKASGKDYGTFEQWSRWNAERQK